MADSLPYLGEINGKQIGRVLKEAVRRAMVTIRQERRTFEATAKMGYGGNMDDVFTSADRKAQEIYLKTFRGCYPFCGVIAEEDELTIEASNGCQAYFTVDPLDGTKAYIRRQSHGVGTMIALVCGTEILSAYIGDINSNEVYGYRPGSEHVYRITDLDSFEPLEYSGDDVLREGYALLRDPPDQLYSQETRQLLSKFKNYEVAGSSIGIWFARLWKREVSALFIPPSFETPWDSTPVLGISQKLGYLCFSPFEGHWRQFTPLPQKEKYRRKDDMLVIHRKDVGQLGRISVPEPGGLMDLLVD